MAVRSTMANMITRIRVLINDPAGGSAIFTDQNIQDVCDESRVDLYNEPLEYGPTYVSGTIQWLSYWHALTNFEDGMVLKQYLYQVVTPSAIDPINGVFTFAASTFPPVFITGSVHDIYRVSADLLERMTARWMLSYDFSSDGQSFKRSQAVPMIEKLIKSYRMSQRASVRRMRRSDITDQGVPAPSGDVIAANPIHRMASG